MRKIFTLWTAMMCSIISFAQDIQLETKDGQIIENGSTVTVKGEMINMYDAYGQFDSHLYVRNLTDKNQGVYAHVKAIEGNGQICFGGGCIPLMNTGAEATSGMGLVEAQSATSLLIDCLIYDPNFMSITVTRTVEVTVWTDKNPDEKIVATVTYTNDPTLLAVENVEISASTVYAKDGVLYCNFADAANRQLQLFNVAGHLCKEIRLTSEAENLSLEGLTKGLYIYRVIEAGKNAESGKFLVK